MHNRTKHVQAKATKRWRAVSVPAIELNLVSIAARGAYRLSPSVRHRYEAYQSHLGMNDFVGCDAIRDDVLRPEFWPESPEAYRVASQLFNLHTRVTSKGDGAAEENAWKKFMRVETRCRRMNRKVRYLQWNPHRCRSVLGPILGSADVLGRIRRTISDVLGPFSPSVYENILKRGRFGPGSTISTTQSAKTAPPYKFLESPTFTSGCLPIWRDWIFKNYPGSSVFGDLDLGIPSRVSVKGRAVPGCRIVFVDKTSTSKRTIAIEPSANIVLQLGVHEYLCTRLEKFGVDLSDQRRNRSMALSASASGSEATIDLSSASDSIAYLLIRWLFPRQWWEFLDRLRSPIALYKGKEIRLEKFSSSGNGLTFVLETILFFALTKVACDVSGGTDYSVYGDDIILSSSSALLLMEWLRRLGFSVNPKKTFVVGPFRESCGLDAFDGVDVRPAMPKDTLSGIVRVIAYHNHLWKRGFVDLCDEVSKSIPERLRVFGPETHLDENGYLFSSNALQLQAHRVWNSDLQSFMYPSYSNRAATGKAPVLSRYLANLFQVGGTYGSSVPLRFKPLTGLSLVARG